jgi:hypothetical protein
VQGQHLRFCRRLARVRASAQAVAIQLSLPLFCAYRSTLEFAA